MDQHILAQEYAAAEAEKRKVCLIYYSVIGGVSVLSCLFLLALEPTVGLIALLSLAGLVGLVMLLTWAGNRANSGGPSPSRPVTIAQVYTRRPPANAWGAMHHGMAAMGLNTIHQVAPTQLSATKGISWTSWGSRHVVDVRPSADRPGLTVVTALTRPVFPLTFTDWGHNAKLNNQILRAAF